MYCHTVIQAVYTNFKGDLDLNERQAGLQTTYDELILGVHLFPIISKSLHTSLISEFISLTQKIWVHTLMDEHTVKLVTH